MVNKAIIARNFGKFAKVYDNNSRLQRRVGFDLIGRSKRFSGRILDVGAGTGFIRKNTDWDIVEIDLSPEVCKINGRAICADAEELPFKEAEFDCLISSLTYQWVDDLQVAMNEAYRVLKKGGKIAFSTFGPSSLTELKTAFSFLDADNHIIEFGSGMKYFAALKKAGFNKLDIESQKITYLYDDIYELLGSIKQIGASYPSASGGLKTRTYFERLENIYKAKFGQHGKLPLSWEVLYIKAVK